jgi:hypothetical protein
MVETVRDERKERGQTMYLALWHGSPEQRNCVWKRGKSAEKKSNAGARKPGLDGTAGVNSADRRDERKITRISKRSRAVSREAGNPPLSNHDYER